jgi:hypothetical protein
MMAILIARVGQLYTAAVSPPHGRATPWRSARPVSAPELIDELLSQGCHQTDIGDAFYEADAEWLDRLEPPQGDE